MFSEERKEVLKLFEKFVFEAHGRIKLASTWFIYDRKSPGNISQYESASESEKINQTKMHDEEPYEINNYCKSFGNIEQKLVVLQTLVTSFGTSISNRLDDILHLIKQCPINLYLCHRSDIQSEKAAQSFIFLSSEAPQKFDELCQSIRGMLKN